VNSDQLYRYVGHLIVGFDGAGHVAWVDPRSGPVSTTAESVIDVGRLAGRALVPPAEITRVYGELTRTALISRLMTVVGQTRVELNGDRRDVRTRETNLGRLVVEALLWQARAKRPDTDIALYNGGGYRGSIPGPQITGFTVASALAFDNPHVILEVTASQLLAAMENAVSRVPAADGRFPQVAGLFVEFDTSRPGVSDQPSMATPSRVKTLRVERTRGAVDPVVTDFRVAGDPGRRFVLATNDFLAGGGDGYQAFKAAATSGTTPLDARSQRALIDYIRQALGGSVALAEPVLPPRVVRLSP
jgi:5'-nucleotidase